MKEVYHVEDIMRILGIGKNTAYKLMQSAGFPATKLGRKYFITEEEFSRWLERNAGKNFEL